MGTSQRSGCNRTPVLVRNVGPGVPPTPAQSLHHSPALKVSEPVSWSLPLWTQVFLRSLSPLPISPRPQASKKGVSSDPSAFFSFKLKKCYEFRMCWHYILGRIERSFGVTSLSKWGKWHSENRSDLPGVGPCTSAGSERGIRPLRPMWELPKLSVLPPHLCFYTLLLIYGSVNNTSIVCLKKFPWIRKRQDWGRPKSKWLWNLPPSHLPYLMFSSVHLVSGGTKRILCMD